jgi:hypothetical protein
MGASRFVQTYPLSYLFFLLPPSDGCLVRMHRGATDGAAGPAMKAAEEAMDLRVGVGGCWRRRRGCHSPDLEGWPGQGWTDRGGAWTGWGGEVRGGAPAAGGVGGGLASNRATIGWPEVEKKALY